MLPSGIGPEGLVAIPSRNLFVTANETDLVEDGLARSHVMIYERAEGPAAYPMIAAGPDRRRHAARLGRAVRRWRPIRPSAGKLYAVSDSVYAGQPSIFTIDATQTPALITGKTVVTRDGDAGPEARPRRHRRRRRRRLLAGHRKAIRQS